MASGSSEVVRIYRSEDSVLAADNRLAVAGFPRRRLLRPGDGIAAVKAAVDAGLLPSYQARDVAQALENGAYALGVAAYFGTAKRVMALMDSAGDAESLAEPDIPLSNPSPLSDALGIPVLSREPSQARLATGFVFSKLFGMPLLSKNPTPLSSLLGVPVLKPHRTSSALIGLNFPYLSKNSTPLSSMLGVKVLKKHRTSSDILGFKFPYLSSNPTPLSSMFGLQVLLKPKK